MADEEQPQDRREQPRLHLRGAITVEHAGARLKAQVANISLDGVRIYLLPKLPAGTAVTLNIPLQGGAVAVVAAEVTSSYPGTAGLRFRWAGADDPNRRLLQEVIGG